MADVIIESISREKFESYEQVRQSGVTNMFNVKLVCDLAELTRDEVMYIMKHYGELSKVFKDVTATNYPNKIGIVNLNKYKVD